MVMTFLAQVNVVSSSDVIVGTGADKTLFCVAYSTSVLSAGLGLAKCLKVGYFQTTSLMIS